MNADQHRKAKHVVAWLAKAEDPDNPDYPITRIKAERWPEVCAAVTENPDLSAKTIAERLGAELGIAPAESKSHDGPISNRDTAPELPPVDPLEPGAPPDIARARIQAIRQSLKETT